jgi:methyltransferase family protein
MITRHQFLTMLHDLLRPHVYLEVGVQYGLSLDLAVHSSWAIGIDPEPLVQAKGNQTIYKMTADKYFVFPQDNAPDQIDLAFIDGSHLFEDALNDFVNIAALCGHKSVVVFDDVLPYTQEMASREPTPGDWTGDVWKTFYILSSYLPNCHLVDTFPTGTMVIWGFPLDQRKLQDWVKFTAPRIDLQARVPDDVINRNFAREPSWVIDRIKEDLWTSQ